MTQEIKHIELEVVNSPTVLVRIIQIVKRRRIEIKELTAAVTGEGDENASVKLIVETDDERLCLLKSQFERVIDVIAIKN